MDKYFTALLQRTNNMDDVVKAGWIDKPEHVPQDLDMYTTNLDRLIDSGLTEVSVLYYPGCFAPVHEGHLQAMRLAKQTVEAAGETVAAGFFAPDHDDYILRKTSDERFIAPNRIQILEKSFTPEDAWMQVDPWAAMYAPTDLNFTTLYDRFQNYLQRWLPNMKVKVYLVFGGDNYLFANSFTEYGYSVVIPREGITIDLDNIHPDAKKRVLVSQVSSTNHSSTAVRATYNQNWGEFLDCYLIDDITEEQVAGSEYSRKIIADALHIITNGHLPHQKAEQVKKVGVNAVIPETEVHEEIFLSSFLLDGTAGVAVTTPNGGTTVMPFLLPYVDVSEHTPVRPDRAYSLSLQAWKTNLSRFKGSDVKIADLKPHRDFEAYGFDPNMTAEQLCEHHLNFLQ